jgi:hypothetical protein
VRTRPTKRPTFAPAKKLTSLAALGLGAAVLLCVITWIGIAALFGLLLQ